MFAIVEINPNITVAKPSKRAMAILPARRNWLIPRFLNKMSHDFKRIHTENYTTVYTRTISKTALRRGPLFRFESLNNQRIARHPDFAATKSTVWSGTGIWIEVEQTRTFPPTRSCCRWMVKRLPRYLENNEIQCQCPIIMLLSFSWSIICLTLERVKTWKNGFCVITIDTRSIMLLYICRFQPGLPQ